jgi:hypothetical protein
MILYHGTNTDFEDIDLKKCNPYKDFGRGFYLTDIKSQAEHWAVRQSGVYGGNPLVQLYLFDETVLTSSELKIKRFEQPTEEWAKFIVSNRFAISPTTQHQYDIVIGPIADDGVAFLLSQYRDKLLNLSQLAKRLRYRKLNRQFCFNTAKAIAALTRLNYGTDGQTKNI